MSRSSPSPECTPSQGVQPLDMTVQSASSFSYTEHSPRRSPSAVAELPGAANVSRSSQQQSTYRMGTLEASVNAQRTNKYASKRHRERFSQNTNNDDVASLYSVAGVSRQQSATTNKNATVTVESAASSRKIAQIADNTEATQLSQGSILSLVLRQSLVAGPVVLLLIAVIAVQFIVMDQVRTTSVRQGQDLVVDNVIRAVTTFFYDKTAIIRNHQYLYATGQPNVDQMIVHPRYAQVNKSTNLPNPVKLQEYEAATAPFFAKDPDLVALYNGFSNEMVWKMHRETPGLMTTQLRFAGTVSGSRYFERYERQRRVNDPLNVFNVTNLQLKAYSPFTQGWFLWANVSTNSAGEFVGGWHGPEFQGTGVGAGTASYGLEPVMVYNIRVNWKQPGLYSVFKLKVLTTRVNEMLRTLDLPRNSDVALVNGVGDLAAYRQVTSQVVADPTDPSNAQLARFLKIWQVPRFSEVTPEALVSNSTHFVASGSSGANIGIFSLDHVIFGWRIVLLIDGDVLLEPYRPLLNTLLSLGIILIALSIVSIAYSVFTIRQRIVSSSQETRARLLDDLLPEEFASRVISRAEWPIADSCTNATVMFSDMVHFTNRCSGLAARDVVILLNHIFERWDVLSTHFGIEKIKTIGDCYMAASGMTNGQSSSDGAAAMILFAMECIDALEAFNANPHDTIMLPEMTATTADGVHTIEQEEGKEEDQPHHHDIVCFRFGIATGDLSIGIIGRKRFCFDIFGDTVNVASRVESNSQPNRVLVTTKTAQLALESEPSLQFFAPEDISVKGKTGHVTVHWVLFGEALAVLQAA